MVPLLLLYLLLAQSTSLRAQNIIILAGQSNMAGRGGVHETKAGTLAWDGVIPAQSQPNPSILRLTANLTWVQAMEPLHADIDYNKTNGVGPGMAFANAVLTREPGYGVIGLVPCAVGGTSISQWRRGGFLYDQMVRRVRTGMEGGGVLRGMLWYQGESDTIDEEDAEAYKGRLGQFFEDVRSDLESPSLPIIQVALASGEGPYIETVREAQLGIRLPNLQCVDAKGLELIPPDKLHLTTASQVQLGQMLAGALSTSNNIVSNFSPRIFPNFVLDLLLIGSFFRLFPNVCHG